MQNNKEKLLFDLTLLGNNFEKNENKTGINRVNHEILKELNSSSKFNLHYYTQHENSENCIKYLKENNFNFENFLSPNGTSQFYEKFSKNKKDLKKAVSKIDSKIRRLFGSISYECYKLFLWFLKRSFSNKASSFKKEVIKYDIVFSGLFEFPDEVSVNKKIKKIFIVYDLIPIKFPEFFGLDTPNDHWLYKILKNLSKDTKVFCISDATKKDFLEFRADMPAENVFSVPLAASNLFYRCKDLKTFNDIQKIYNLPDADTYILSVCTLEPRKNLKRLISAFYEYIKENQSSDLKLVLTGNKGWLFEDIIDNEIVESLKNRIIFTGFVEDHHLASVYSNCKFFAYASLYEGFGLPILEAMQCGCAVISSNTSSMPEVGGDAVLYTNPENIDEITQRINELDNNESLRKKLEAKAFEHAKKFSWKNTVDEILSNSN